MNINVSIGNALERENRRYHEESQCISCTNGTNIKNGVWTKVDELQNCSPDRIGLVHYFDGENVMMLPFAHELVIGSTGTGKSEVFYKNQCLLANLPKDKKPSFLFTDVKGNIHSDLAPMLKNQGYNVIVYDLRNPYKSARYNFLLQIFDDYQETVRIKKLLDVEGIGKSFDGKLYDTEKKAQVAAECKRAALLDSIERAINELCSIIVQDYDPKDRMWTGGARTMLGAIIWTMLRDSEDPETGMTREKFILSNICYTAFSTGDDCEEISEWLMRAKDILCVKSAIVSNYRLRAKTTRDGYVSTLNTALGEYSSSTIGAITSTSDEIDLRKIAGGKDPYAIFVITDERQKTTHNICLMFINNLINELVMVADSTPEHALPRDFVIMADEFANMPPLPNLSNKITTLRSRRIWMVMAIQSIQQLDMVYGKETSDIIQDNCDIQMFLGCNNDETKETFARSMGKTIGVKTSFSIFNDGNISISKGTEDVPVIRKSDLDNLTLGEFYIRARQSQNFKGYMMPFFMRTDRLPALKDDDIDFREYNPTKNLYDINKVLEMEKAKQSPQRRSFNFDF